jgi:Flp pilus assembly protein TadD
LANQLSPGLATQFGSDFARAYCHRGTAKLSQGDTEGAIADFTKAIQLRPNLMDAYKGRSAAKRAKGDMVGASADLATATALR